MWRKTEAKPASPVNAPAPAKDAEEPKQAQQGVSQQSSAAAATPAGTAVAAAEKAPVAVEASAKQASEKQGSATAGVATAASTTTPAPAAPAKSAAVAPAAASQWTRPAAMESSTISAGLKIKGEITGTSDLTVDGETQGKIRLVNGRVTVGPNGKVTADIDAREIVVNGTVQGNLKASESVRLGASGHVEGSILTPRIGIDDGARLRGNVEMVKPGETQNAERRERQETPQAARAASATGATVSQE